MKSVDSYVIAIRASRARGGDSRDLSRHSVLSGTWNEKPACSLISSSVGTMRDSMMYTSLGLPLLALSRQKELRGMGNDER